MNWVISHLTGLSFHRVLMGCAALALAGMLPAPASGQEAQQGGQESGTALTIYSSARPGAIPPELYRPIVGANVPHPGQGQNIPGYAVIRQERDIAIKGQRDTVRFSDVAALIDPTTVTFASLTDPDGTRVLDQNYQFDLVSTDRLMERYLGKEITVEQVQGDKTSIINGTLLSTSGGLVLKTDNDVRVLSNYANVRFPELPGGLISRPTLVWNVTAQTIGQHRMRVTYQTSGITWWADYNVIFSEGKDADSGVLDVGAWVSIINQSGAGYTDAKLKLIAGDVHRAPKPERRRVMVDMMAEAAAAPDGAGFEEKAFFEYHLYTLGRPATLPDNSTKQIELFPTARNVPCEKVLVYYGLPQEFRGLFPNPMTDRNFGTQSNKKVDIYLRFKNEKDRGMGMPLPAGRIRVSKLDPADKSLEFIGEDVIDHTPKDEEVLIKMGSAFDVVGERKQVDFQVDTRAHTMQETIEIKLRNHKEEPVKVIVKENLFRWLNWKITDKTHDFEKVDARTIHFPVTVPKDGEVTVRYTVKYTW
ncbi:MAG TPA: DUF4139 domain-containing protein [Phycisphaerae bacterium]|nr:DUF4139 domain-containing protein [Phycisphaerae bacterium]HOL25690.1 DUF4139 domain-containing protein [Phycisphaerae bacterium]HPP19617.1 DUF4139 domain-containing protein [Phycisphaerae bacterium]HPU34436.1 DUF4139 domain-containing protein [Phycisphaerae bacterium]